MRTILVTGAAGYVGGALTRRLLDQPETSVIGVDFCAMDHGAEGVREIIGRPGFTFVREDIRNTDAIEPLLERADAVVHLAAIVGDPACRRDPDETVSINIDATGRLIDASKRHGIEHFVFVSTCSNYGVSDTSTLVTEDGDLNPVSLYAESKVAVEKRLLENGDLPATVCRFATVYGVAPRMRFDLTVNQFTIEALRDGVLEIYGEQFWRPYVHVEDAARGVQLVLAKPDVAVGRVYNVGDSEENYTKGMMYELLKERLPDLEAKWVSIDEDPRSYKVSFQRIADELGYETTWDVPRGMDQIIEYARLGAFPEPKAPRFRN
ncbi:NAD-dependent epimerase/dehydratase family protein [Miltoncostaea marina]|uniref:NAD-dependent epimerase/dehydratase family protein n=1 Tax=Miltoncostaea marina TaxID=2843215 RepID=UPI001C3C9E06|nr:NAD(P)-dependent oxidoreductase [Miltoncostaea marina]